MTDDRADTTDEGTDAVAERADTTDVRTDTPVAQLAADEHSHTAQEHTDMTDEHTTDDHAMDEPAIDLTDGATEQSRRWVPTRKVAAALALGLSFTMGATLVASSATPEPAPVAATAPATTAPAAEDRAADAEAASRSAERTTPPPAPTVVGSMYVTEDINVRSAPSYEAEVVGGVAAGEQVEITDQVDRGWQQITYGDSTAWVSSAYLSEEEPELGLSTAPCPASSGGSAVEEGLTDNAIAVHRAVCAEFPEIDTYGGVRASSGEHGQGRALDIMVSDPELGDAIAEFCVANAEELGISEVIWSQQIWTVQRADEGWRQMEDRGNATDNHYDHVHVTVY